MERLIVEYSIADYECCCTVTTPILYESAEAFYCDLETAIRNYIIARDAYVVHSEQYHEHIRKVLKTIEHKRQNVTKLQARVARGNQSQTVILNLKKQEAELAKMTKAAMEEGPTKPEGWPSDEITLGGHTWPLSDLVERSDVGKMEIFMPEVMTVDEWFKQNIPTLS